MGLLQVLAGLSKAGHCVVVGRGAPHLLPADRTLAVRVVAPRAWRVARVQQQRGVTAAEAERWVTEHDREREAFVRGHHADPTDPTLYHLLING